MLEYYVELHCAVLCCAVLRYKIYMGCSHSPESWLCFNSLTEEFLVKYDNNMGTQH